MNKFFYIGLAISFAFSMYAVVLFGRTMIVNRKTRLQPRHIIFFIVCLLMAISAISFASYVYTHSH